MLSLAQNYLTRGFWGDEAWTSLISQLPYFEMIKTTAADFHPPGYYSVIELLYQFVAPSEINTRIISIIFYFLTLFLVYKLASDIKGKLFGIISMAVVAVNPIFFTYAFEARNYTMFAFAATGSIYFLIELSKQFTKWRALGFVLFSVLGIYTHYYMFFTLAAQGLYLILFDRKIFLKMMGLYAGIALLYIPWAKVLFSQLTSVGESYWIGGIDARTHYEAFLRILGGEHQNMFRPVLFGLSILLLLVGIGQHTLRLHFEKPYVLIWLWAIVPFILASLPGLKIGDASLPFRPIFFWRYLINASVPLAMIMVHAAQKFPKIVYLGMAAAIIFLSVAIDFQTFSRYPYGFEQVYGEKVLNEIDAGDLIVTNLPSFAEVMYYKQKYNLENKFLVVPEGLVQFSGKSLLDAYVDAGWVEIAEPKDDNYFMFERVDGWPQVQIDK